MGSAYKIYAALCLLAVCTAGVLGDPETATWKRPDTPQKNVTLQLIGYTAKGTVPAGAEQVGHPRVFVSPEAADSGVLHGISLTGAAYCLEIKKHEQIAACRCFVGLIVDAYRCSTAPVPSAEVQLMVTKAAQAAAGGAAAAAETFIIHAAACCSNIRRVL
jgi:hypothetical protein